MKKIFKNLDTLNVIELTLQHESGTGGPDSGVRGNIGRSFVI